MFACSSIYIFFIHGEQTNMFLISVTIILVYGLKEISGKVDQFILNGLKQEDPKLIEAIKDHILIPPQTKLPYNFSLVR